ncbi:hypothetical protein FRB90_011750 [Tulasnella sp. 427]|nr:hypothetical protein FRB90_011750 [Tulasnella sp. 427]
MNFLRIRSGVSTRSLCSSRQTAPKIQPLVRPNSTAYSTTASTWQQKPTATHLNDNSSQSWKSRLLSISAVSALVLGVSLATSEPLRLESSYILGFEDDKVAESYDTTTEPSSGIEFPKIITFKSPQTLPLTLMAVGIRTVSFLKIQVYAIAFYADLTKVDLKGLTSPEKKLEYLIKNKAVAVRIVAVRNTSFHHLRDAYIRALNVRLGVLRKSKDDVLTAEQEDAIQDSLQVLKSTFPPSSLAKKVPFYMVLSTPAASETRFVSIPTLKGKIENAWVAEELFRNYFTGDGPSPKLKQSVLESLDQM